MSKAARNARYYAKKKELLAAAQDRAARLSAENFELQRRLKTVRDVLGVELECQWCGLVHEGGPEYCEAAERGAAA